MSRRGKQSFFEQFEEKDQKAFVSSRWHRPVSIRPIIGRTSTDAIARLEIQQAVRPDQSIQHEGTRSTENTKRKEGVAPVPVPGDLRALGVKIFRLARADIQHHARDAARAGKLESLTP